jgi:hypothetical protein
VGGPDLMATTVSRPAWYLTGGGRWRDWINLLHGPYTLWHLSYVAIGAGLATRVSSERLVATLLAFFLAVGVAAHALDEVHGRPLGTAIPSLQLVGAAVASLAGATAIGVVGVSRIGWPLLIFVGAGVMLVAGYNLELFGGRLHNDLGFAASWGAFPLLTAFYAQTETIRFTAVAGAVFALGLSLVQRVLSTESRHLRRQVEEVRGEKVLRDGTRQRLDLGAVLSPIDGALQGLSWTVVALAAALITSRLQ